MKSMRKLLGAAAASVIVSTPALADPLLVWEDQFNRCGWSYFYPASCGTVGNGWAESPGNDVDLSKIQYSSNYALRLRDDDDRDQTIATQSGISLAGYESLSVKIRWKVSDDDDIRFYFDWRVAGTETWTSLLLGDEENYTVTWSDLGVAADDGVIDIAFRARGRDDDREYGYVDYVQIYGLEIPVISEPEPEIQPLNAAIAPNAVVPAPATLALLGIGLLGMGFSRRRT